MPSIDTHYPPNTRVTDYIIDAPARLAAQIGDTAQVQQATATAAGIRSFKSTTTTMYSVAMSGMPKFRNAIEMIAYAIFPLIVIVIVVAGPYAGTFLKGYAGSLLWVQLWPPLYAIMNYMMNLKTQSAVGSMVAVNGEGYLSCNLTNWLGTTAVDDMTVAAYLTLSIPVIAWGLVQGSLQAASGAAASWTQGSGASGGRFLDNTVRSDQITAGQYNMAPTINTGAPMRRVMGANGVAMGYTADGTQTVDASGISNRVNFQLDVGSRMSAGLNQRYEETNAAATSNVVSAGKEIAAAINQVGEFTRARGKSTSSGTSFATSDMAKASQSLSEAQNIAKNFEKQHGLKEGMGAKVAGELSASAGAKFFGTGLETSLKASGFSDATLSDEKKMAEAYKQAQSYTAAIERASQVSSQSKFDTGDSEEAKAMRGIRASLGEAKRYSEQASANYSESQTLSKAMTRAEENSAAWKEGWNRQFLDWMGTQDNRWSGKKFDRRTVADMAEHDPDSLREYKDRFVKERIESELSVGMGKMKTKEELQASHEDDKKRVEGASNVQAQGEKWLGGVDGAADKAGLNENVTSTLPQQVAEGLGSAEKATGEGRGKIEADGKPIESTVKANVEDPGSLAARASSNGLAAVTPQGTTYLLDQVGAAPGSFAKRDAETYKGDTKDALIDTVIWAGTVAVGGGLGTAAGRNIVGATVGKISGKAAGEIIGETAGNVVGATLGKEAADNRDGALDLLNGTLNQGKSAIGGLFDGSPGGTGFGNLFGGGTRPAPTQQQPTEGSDSQQQKGDAPPQ